MNATRIRAVEDTELDEAGPYLNRLLEGTVAPGTDSRAFERDMI